ncbi:unnamed protein product, partial [Ilex paraguariensis]
MVLLTFLVNFLTNLRVVEEDSSSAFPVEDLGIFCSARLSSGSRTLYSVVGVGLYADISSKSSKSMKMVIDPSSLLIELGASRSIHLF